MERLDMDKHSGPLGPFLSRDEETYGLYFLHNLKMGPIDWSVSLHLARKAYQ